jgi:hypothetical protein
MTEIGKIGKPEVSIYKNKKKVYFVRNIFLPKNATDKYKDIYYRYWREVDEHLTRLELAGKVSKIFCESIYMTGEESMKVLSAMNVQLEQIVKKKIEAGGEFLPLEDRDIFGAYVDWSNCLMLVRTPGVYKKVHGFLKDAVKDRFEHIRAVFKKHIAEGEAGLLIMRDEDREHLELPDNMEMFFVTPPAYDDLLQFIRDSSGETEYWRKNT